MKFSVCTLLLLLTIIPAAAENVAQFDSQAAPFSSSSRKT